MGSSPNFRGAGALLRGTSRAFSPKRGGIRRDTPSVCLTGEGSVPPPRRPLPSELGTTFFHKLKFYSIFFKKLRFPKAEPLVAHRNERNTLSCEALFSGELPRSGKRGPFASEKAPLRKEIRNSFSILGWTRTLPSAYIYREACIGPMFTVGSKAATMSTSSSPVTTQ